VVIINGFIYLLTGKRLRYLCLFMTSYHVQRDDYCVRVSEVCI